MKFQSFPKQGDLVKHVDVRHEEWGFGLVVKMIMSEYDNHYPWLRVYWPKWNKVTNGPITKFRVFNESG